MMTDMHRALARLEFEQRELLNSHLPYEQETRFYRAIQSGDRALVEKLYTPLGQEGFGTLSQDALRNLKYHLVITVAFITRYCIEGGMDAETAYNLSDLYIRRVDVSEEARNIHELHHELVMAYTERIQALAAKQRHSRPMMKCIDYIHTHLHLRITVEELCAVSGLSRAYLSRLFREETGLTIMQYVTGRKLSAACRELELSARPVAEVAQIFAFSSESHFISVFRHHYGLTPREYRRSCASPARSR